MTWSDEPRPSPAAGWYADPAGSGGLRYWDGTTWTGHVTAPPAAQPVAPYPAAPAATYAPAPPAPPKAKTPVWVWIALGGTVLLFGLGILAAIAVPTFHVARDAVWDEEAKTNLRDAYDVAAAARSVSGTFATATPEQLAGRDSRFTWTSAASSSPQQVSVYALDQRITLAVRSRSGACWVIDDDTSVRGAAGYRTGRLPGEQLPCSAAAGGPGLVEEDF